MRITYALAAVLLAACGGGGGSDDDVDAAGSDGPPTIDAVARCDVEDTFNTAAPDPATDTLAFATVDNGQPPHDIVMVQWMVPGTAANPDYLFFTIPRPVPTGEVGTALDIGNDACVVGRDFCVKILTDFNAGHFQQLLYPDTGTLTLGLTGTGQAGDVLTMTMSDTLFNHYDPGTGEMIHDGCSTNVTGFGPINLTINPDAFAPTTGPRAQQNPPVVADRH